MWEALQPAVLEIASAIIAAAIAAGTMYIRRWTGIQIEEKHRKALHEAIYSGVASAVKFGPAEGTASIKAHAIAYARESVPDAIKALTPGDGVLDRLAERYVRETLARFGDK